MNKSGQIHNNHRIQTHKIFGIVFVILLFLCFLIFGTPSAYTSAAAVNSLISLDPSFDTYVNQGSPNTNYEAAPTLDMGADEFLSERIPYLSFPIDDIPENATIISAELRLHLVASSSNNHTLTVYRIFQPWDANTVTWNNRPAMLCCWGSSNIGTTTDQTYTWDVTGLVNDWHVGTYPNYGLAIYNASDVDFFKNFSSSEGVVTPQLVVEYVLPNTPTPVPLPDGSISGTIWRDDDHDSIVDSRETRLNGVLVNLVEDGVVVDTVFSNDSGLYMFEGVPTGDYRVQVERFIAPGMELVNYVTTQEVILSAGEDVTNIDFGYDNPETDLRVDRLEVTQAIQNEENSVRLVSNKRTYVRVHVSSTSGNHYTMAVLRAQRGSLTTTLLPITPFIYVRSDPDRTIANHAFLFELPDGFRSGNVSLEAEVNPILPGLHTRHDPLEVSYNNNRRSTSVSFEPVPELWVDVYRLRYEQGGIEYEASDFHVDKFISWLERAYPVSSVRHTVGTYRWYIGGRPECWDVNFHVGWDIFFGNLPPRLGRHVYVMVDDGGGFMRGCSLTPAWNGSGPTGPGTYGWDYDGSYGDWYGAHEFAHTLGRGHVWYCGTGGGVGYPTYPHHSGSISSVERAGDWYVPTHVGFDILTREVYGPLWRDVMTYCRNQWISEYTYEGLMDIIQSISRREPATKESQGGATDRLFVNGVIHENKQQAELGAMFVIPDVEEVGTMVPGEYDIVLQAADSTELARYAFTPFESHSGPGEPGTSGSEISQLTILELVPYVEGTAKVIIEGPDGSAWGSVSAGLAVPSVTITSPTGGDITGESVTVSWTASDADNDPLNFVVEYSTDNGTTWKVASLRTNNTSIEISAANLPQSTQARFRVWVSDGIHTSSDISNIITKPNSPPTAVITGPETGSTFVVSQTISLVAQAFDIDTGSMTSDQLSWTSNLDGALGNGEQLSVSDLSTGVHTITFTADDGVGGLMTDQIQISIVDTFAELPPVDSLIVGPNTLLFDSRFDWGSDLLSIENANGLNAINWNMSASESWIQLGANSGVTPDDVSIAIDMSSLEEGTHTASVTVTSPDVIDQTITIPVHVVIEPNKLYLPLVLE